ncbi:MAG: LysM peptidoglycan-binding domain-containing protein [Candidatus Cloacimonadales bacterium]|jgi:membrane-bound lytic murein transglycosylase D|nr:LysM peptidoglycan-binding domain-containing protein [Candidatus Cloacimonadales bacterium]
MKRYVIVLLMFISLFSVLNAFLFQNSKKTKNKKDSDIDALLDLDSLYQIIEKQSLTIFELQSIIDDIYCQLDSLQQGGFENDYNTGKDFVLPESYEFAGVSFDLKNERMRNKLQTIFSYELKRAPVFLARSSCYFPIFESYFEEHGVPDDAKYLAVAESNLSYMAFSSVGAAGIWQFMPGTAKLFNLNINDYIDERRNVFKSTDAACKYLIDGYNNLLKRDIDDWLLAMASYNAGMGNIYKAINEQGAQSFFSLIMRHDETNNYIWRAIAIKMIFENEEQLFGKRFTRDSYLLDQAKLVDIELKGHHNLNEWAIAQGTNLSTVWELNPWIKINKRNQGKYSKINEILLPPGQYQILVPIDAIADTMLLAKAEKTFAAPTTTVSKYHKVRSGETLNSIAKKYGTTVNHLKSLNNMKSDRLNAGKNLLVTGSNGTTSKSSTSSYTVKDGDNLYKISKKLGVSIQHLMSKNNLKIKKIKGKEVVNLRKGQVLVY